MPVLSRPRLFGRPSAAVPAGRRRGRFDEVGEMAVVAYETAHALVAGPRDFGLELFAQLRLALRISLFPLVLTAFALSFGPAGVQGSAFLSLFGALDRLGGAYVLIVIREFGPLVTAIVVAGVCGTAMCSDLGARVVRDEVDALRVLGIDPRRALVVPRVLALVLVCLLYNSFALLSGVMGAVLVVVQNHGELGPFFANFFSAATPLELAASYVKAGLYGAVIGVVCCQLGMSVSGGAEAVGRAVNRAVVIAFLAIGAIDYVFVQMLLATHPQLSEIH